MNKIYKVIYSKVRNCYVVVSELAKNNGKGTSRGAVVGSPKRTSLLAAVLAAGVLSLGTFGTALAAGPAAIENGAASKADGIGSIAVGVGDKVVSISNRYQGATSLAVGTLNIVDADDKVPFDGVASSVIGQVNYTKNANAAVIMGAGNKVTNSYRDVKLDENTLSKWIQAYPNDMETVKKILQNAVPESGGQVMAFGGGNVVDNAYMTQVIGVGNTVKGNQKKNTDGTWSSNGTAEFHDATSSQLNYVDGFYTTLINGKNDYLIGAHNTVTGDSVKQNRSNIVIGDNHTLENQSNNIILGSADNALSTTASQVTILGHNANATVDGGAAIGAESVASMDANAIGYDPVTKKASTDTSSTWKSTAAAVSVGDASKNITRQITNVAAGTQDTDAVNVAQLKAVSTASKTKYYSVQKMPFTEAQLGSYAGYTNEANDGAKKMGALAAGYMTYAGGIASTVTGSLSGVINQAAAPGNMDFRGATALSYGTFNINNNSDKSGTFSGVANSIVGQANMTTDSNAALIYGAGNVISNSYRAIDITKMGAITDNLKDPKALGEALQAAVPTSGGQVMAFGGGNVVDNAYMTQVIGVGNTVKGNQKKNDDGTWTSKDNTGFDKDASSQLNYVDGFYTTLINGKNDYLIGAHNTVTGESVDKNHSNIVIGDNHTLENQSNNIILGSADSTLPTTASQVTIVGHNANATVDGGVAIGAESVASMDANAIGYDPVTKKASTDTSSTWKSTAAAVSVGDASQYMTRQITGVAAGFADTDAVNVAQLKSVASLPVHIYSGGKVSSGSYTVGSLVANPTISSLQFDFGDGLKAEEVGAEGDKRVLVSLDKNALKGDPDFKGDKGDKGDTGATGAQGEKGDTGKQGPKGDTGAKGDKGDKGDTGAPGKDGGVGTVVGDDTNITVANTETDANKPANYKVSLNNAITVDKVTAGATTISSNGVSIAGGPSMTKDGIDAGGSKITNVAAGTADTDAVNYGQLKGVESNVQNNTTNINRLNGRVNDLDSRINKVGAGAAALAALHPQDFNPDDKWDFAVGYGNYRDANAMAIGAFYRPDENVMFSMGTNFGNGENMINAGVTFKLGPKNHTTSNKYLLSKEVTTLRATVAQQDAQLKQQSNEIKELREMVSKLLAKEK
ncbi:ESPR-type extended signal peptide-containing protein [Acidaminococcus timonensis]|uniref:ESPR-type extended signal peptide-containing protein n=1 Tax=Acidaminococcus timonensis TaxID=1871002 RepID=UPI00307B52DE